MLAQNIDTIYKLYANCAEGLHFSVFIIIVIFAEKCFVHTQATASFACLEALTTPKPQNTDTNEIHATWA